MKGFIYAIKSHQTSDIYIGSTIQILSKRLINHKSDYKLQHHYITAFEILKYDDVYIELIEIVEFTEKNKLYEREAYYIRTMNCVNKNIPSKIINEEIITQNNINNEEIIKQHQIDYQQKSKQYRIDNNETIKKRHLQYYIDNREKIREKAKKAYKLKKEQLLANNQ